MKIIITYDVDMTAYSAADKHIILHTRMLTSRNETIVYQRMHRDDARMLSDRISQSINLGYQHETEHYFHHKSYGKPKKITLSTYNRKRATFLAGEHTEEIEEVARLEFTNAKGRLESVSVQVIIRDGTGTAVIDFENVEQYKALQLPNWLRECEQE